MTGDAEPRDVSVGSSRLQARHPTRVEHPPSFLLSLCQGARERMSRRGFHGADSWRGAGNLMCWSSSKSCWGTSNEECLTEMLSQHLDKGPSRWFKQPVFHVSLVQLCPEPWLISKAKQERTGEKGISIFPGQTVWNNKAGRMQRGAGSGQDGCERCTPCQQKLRLQVWNSLWEE